MAVNVVYIIYSMSVDRYYVGQTDELEKRLVSHNNGESPYTSIASDWILKHTEEFATRTLARKRENAIKKKKSRKYIEWLIESASSRQMSG